MKKLALIGCLIFYTNTSFAAGSLHSIASEATPPVVHHHHPSLQEQNPRLVKRGWNHVKKTLGIKTMREKNEEVMKSGDPTKIANREKLLHKTGNNMMACGKTLVGVSCGLGAGAAVTFAGGALPVSAALAGAGLATAKAGARIDHKGAKLRAGAQDLEFHLDRLKLAAKAASSHSENSELTPSTRISADSATLRNNSPIKNGSPTSQTSLTKDSPDLNKDLPSTPDSITVVPRQ